MKDGVFQSPRGAHKTQYKFVMKQIESARKLVGLPPIQVKIKRCLSCEKTFRAFGRGQHLCESCRKKDGYEP